MSQTPIRLVQFTDLHLYGAVDGRLRGTETLPAFEAALAQAHAATAPWEAVLLTGDLVQDDPNGYRHVQRLLGDSAVPVYCIPGNHDEIAAMRTALADAPFQIGGTARHGEWVVVLLDSCLAGHADGRISAAELGRLDSALSAHADRHALVCLHHHPVAAGSRWLDAVALQNPEALFEVLDRHANVRALVWGHVHQSYDGRRGNVRLVSTPSTCAQFKPGSDQFAIDHRPPGYRWFDLYPDGRIETAVVWVPGAATAGAAARAATG